MSTGMWTTLVSPSTQTNRQTTMMKYGCRMENDGIETPIRLPIDGCDELGRNQLPGFVLTLLAENNEFVFLKAGKNFDIGGGLHSQLDVALFDLI